MASEEELMASEEELMASEGKEEEEEKGEEKRDPQGGGGGVAVKEGWREGGGSRQRDLLEAIGLGKVLWEAEVMGLDGIVELKHENVRRDHLAVPLRVIHTHAAAVSL